MGCDIHMIAEKRSRYADENTEWAPMLDPIFKDDFYNKDRALSHYNKPYTFQPYDDRNYVLFSILADIRNGYDIEPIAEPRDLPEDLHTVSNWLLSDWDFIDHSPTWLTLDEVLAYPWNSEFVRHGVVNREQYEIFRKEGKPHEWSSAVIGGNVQVLPVEDMEALILGNIPDLGKSYYTSVEWKNTYADVCKGFLDNMQLLKEYAENDNCDIRLVFGFDN